MLPNLMNTHVSNENRALERLSIPQVLTLSRSTNDVGRVSSDEAARDMLQYYVVGVDVVKVQCRNRQPEVVDK